ncbi:MAG: DUF420 domain-containing protein [Candidatus Zixiibacteriota bacterium]
MRFLPTLNAVLNAVSAILLFTGYAFIKKKEPVKHKKTMITAVITSALFLISYLMYHQAVGSVPYPRHDWTRIVYFIVLIPHVILAGLMVPFILIGLYFAFSQKFDKHRKLMKFILPVWLFVSLSGIVIYIMLYHL